MVRAPARLWRLALARYRALTAEGLAGAGGVVRSAGVLASGTAAAQAVLLLYAPIGSRLYSPEEYGLLAGYTSALTIAGLVSTGCYEQAIPIARDDDRARGALCLAGLLAIATALVVAAALALGGQGAARAANLQGLAPYLWLAPVVYAIDGIHRALRHWALRRRAFTTVAKTQMAQAVSSVAVNFAGGVAGVGVIGLLLADMASRVAGTSSLGRLARRDAGGRWGEARRLMPDAAREYRGFPAYTTWSMLLNGIGYAAPGLFWAATYGPHTAGLIAAGQRLVGLPMRVVGTAVGQAYLSLGAAALRTERAELNQLFWGTARRLALVAVVPLGLVAALAPAALGVILGPKWRQAGAFVQVMVPAYFCQFVVSPLSHTPALVQRQRMQLIFDIARAAMVVATFAAAGWLRMSPLSCAAAYTAATVISYAGLFCLYARLAAPEARAATPPQRSRQCD